MNTKENYAKPVLYASMLAFISFVIYIFCINREVFFTAQDRSEFLYGSQFFNTLMTRPFGLTQYVAAWLAQFFYHPVWGTALLGAIWVLTFIIGKAAFRLHGAASALMLLPIACLLTSVVDLGYWIYFLTIKGYWFSQSLGYLAMVTLLWAARCTPRKWHIIWYIIGVILYPVLGWFAMLFVICLVLSDNLSNNEIVAIILLFVTANIWHALLYTTMNIKGVLLAGFPIFETPSDKSEMLSLPFWLLGAITILIPLCSKYASKWFVPVCCAIAGMVFTWTFMFKDKNYIDEMRIARATESENWQEVLDIFTEVKEPTLSMVALKNLALMYDGGILDRSFKMGNEFIDLYNPESIHVSFLEIASPLAYYNYGMINEGFRLSFECAIQSGFSPFYLRMLARCAKANGERPLAERYISQLQGHPFYADWTPSPMSDKTIALKNSYLNELTGVENSYSYIVNEISLWHQADNKYAAEQALFFSMMRCDSKRFWASIRKYAKTHMNEEVPIHAQEAYILYFDRAPEAKRIMIPVKDDIYERYKDFWTNLENLASSGINPNEIPGIMKMNFGDTYWWYNIFGTKVH